MGQILDAILRGDIHALRNVLDRSGDMDERDRSGATPLMQAVVDGRVDFVRELLSRHANVNASDEQGRTALHFAAQEFRVEIAEMLVKAGANVDPVDVHGNTPLWRAVFESKGRGEMIKLLLQHGADPRKKNNRGVSPRDLASRIANYDVAQHLAQQA